MSLLHRVGDLDISEDPRFTRKSWLLERVGWGVLGLILAAGVAGALGPGPISHTVSGNEALRLEFDRFGRVNTPEELRIRARGDGRRAEAWLDRGYIDQIAVEAVTPPPLEVRTEGGFQKYTFAADGAHVSITVDFRFRHSGTVRGRLAGPGSPPLEFSHFVYP